MLTIENKFDLGQPVLAYATCWKLERVDGQILYLTDHDKEINLDTQTYTPIGGFNASAVEELASLKASNRELVGIIDSSAITFDDLRAGLYFGAEITEYLVDWRWPWAGEITTRIYELGDAVFDETIWNVEVVGIAGKLQRAIGEVYTRMCRVNLFSDECKVVKASHEFAGSVSTVETQRRVIRTSVLGSPAKDDDWFNLGEIEWISGSNSGLKSEIKTYVKTNSEIEFQLPVPFDIVVSDTFNIWTGCNRGKATCKDKFSNLINYRGFPTIPGLDRALRTPVMR